MCRKEEGWAGGREAGQCGGRRQTSAASGTRFRRDRRGVATVRSIFGEAVSSSLHFLFFLFSTHVAEVDLRITQHFHTLSRGPGILANYSVENRKMRLTQAERKTTTPPYTFCDQSGPHVDHFRGPRALQTRLTGTAPHLRVLLPSLPHAPAQRCDGRHVPLGCTDGRCVPRPAPTAVAPLTAAYLRPRRPQWAASTSLGATAASGDASPVVAVAVAAIDWVPYSPLPLGPPTAATVVSPLPAAVGRPLSPPPLVGRAALPTRPSR